MAIRRSSLTPQEAQQQQQQQQQQGLTVPQPQEQQQQQQPSPADSSSSSSTGPSRAAALMQVNTQALSLFWEGSQEDAVLVLQQGIALGERALEQLHNTMTSPSISADFANDDTSLPLSRLLSLSPLSLDQVVDFNDDDDDDDYYDEEEDNGMNVEYQENDGMITMKMYPQDLLFFANVFLMEPAQRDSNNYYCREDNAALRHVVAIMCFNLAVLQHQVAMVQGIDENEAMMIPAYYRKALYWLTKTTPSCNTTTTATTTRMQSPQQQQQGQLLLQEQDTALASFCQVVRDNHRHAVSVLELPVKRGR